VIAEDKRIIDFCNQRCWMLVTPDRDVRFTHVEDIEKTEIAILATANNNSPTNEWVDALIQGKVGIERYFRKHPPIFRDIQPQWECNVGK
jgi:hypothetical protein